MPHPVIFITRHWLGLSALILLSITLLSLWPLGTLPIMPGTDKTHHFIAYGALMLPTALAKPKHWPLIALFFISWSAAIELIQPYVNRYGEWLDLLANASGVVSAIVLAFIFDAIKKRCKPIH